MSTPRILVVGATGMLGHEALRVLAPDLEVWGACRDRRSITGLGVPAGRLVEGLDAADPASAAALVERVRPDLVLNAVGIVKQLDAARAAIPSITVNSLWPHVLADACAVQGARLVHVSTDCVFSGSRGGYTEDDVPDAGDLYGRSKLLGEVADRDNVVTLRTSIIGWQLGEPTALAGWFAAHRHEPLKGFTRAVFSGLTTQAFTAVVRDVVLPDVSLHGLWHLSAAPIDKYTLLTGLAGHLGWEVRLDPVDEPAIDRSLDSSRLRERTGWAPPAWDAMLAELAAEWPGAEKPGAGAAAASGSGSQRRP
jgi:dTDP-4-dehydrorhamnose reductase